MRSSDITFVLLSVVATVRSHATFQELWINSVDQVGSCVRLPPTNSPITDLTSTDLRCNVGGTVGVSGVCSVAAGGNVTVEMHQQPGDRSCANEAIGGAHYGPVILYMSKVSNAATDTGSGSWFKQTLNANCGKRSFTIPSTLAPGDYLLRAEVIALHVAGSVGGAQLYMSCFQLRVTGSGSKNPTGVLFPGAYSATDPGILINIYQTINNYTIPGPTTVFTG
ncbi:putative endo-beta-1,4-glucanase D [Botrytis cinerea]